jgi:thiol-disulfide isomerase/thioredoxin
MPTPKNPGAWPLFQLGSGFAPCATLALALSGCMPSLPASGAASTTPRAEANAGDAQSEMLALRRLAASRAECPVPVERALREAPARIAPDERVPDFLLASERCEIFDSRALVGKRPFVVVFFASWCSVCEHKMPAIRDALEERGDELTSLFVSLDEAEGWAGTEQFLARHGLVPTSAVVGRDFLSFSLGYNPFRSVPVVVVVGRSGHVVDVQVGVHDGDDERLLDALDIAIDELPEGSQLTSFPRP